MCPDCEQQFRDIKLQTVLNFSYNKRLSYHEAESIVAGHVKSIKGDITALQEALNSYGDILLSRWKKKGNSTKREAWLHEADPKMFQHQWLGPYFSRDYTRGYNLLEVRKELWQVLRLPYLTVEALAADANKLVGILHHRAYSLPEEWVVHDSRQLSLGWYNGLFDLDFSDACVVMHGPRWGELTKWDEAAAHRFSIIGFPRASIILEAQSTLLRVLLKIVNQILLNADGSLPAASGNTKWIESIKGGFKYANSIELRSPYTNSAFSAPRSFDINEILSTAHARLEAATDHLFLLQTDPSYMRWAISTYNLGEMVRRVGKDFARGLTAGELLHDFREVQRWKWLVEECEHLKLLYTSFRDQIYPTDRLPPRYDRALGAIRLIVTNQVLSQSRQLEHEFPQKPGFSRAYNFERTAQGCDFRRKKFHQLNDLFWDDRLEWAMINMVGNFQDPQHYDQEVVFAILEDHLQKSSAAERGRLDERLYAKLADFSARHEILYSIDSHRPLDTNPHMDDLKKSERDRKVWRFMAAKLRDLPRRRVLHLAECLERFEGASLPPQKPDARLSLEVLDKSREALGLFWAAIRDYERDTMEGCKELLQADVEDYLAVLSPASFSDYTNAISAQRAALVARNEARVKKKTNVASEYPQTVWGTSNEGNIERLGEASRTKLKTRPTVAVPSSGKEVLLQDAIRSPTKVEPLSVPLPLKYRTRAIFSRMFPRDPEKIQKPVDWTDFVLSMGDVGFTAKHSGGSAVIFENETKSRKIVFHRPHPIAKIYPVMIRAMGSRMKKWFGWDREYLGLDHS
ncbi:hypothetical protein MPH_05094 [Macrophomina phaseolina MS6]|uniref:Uncharacterized protein n=1 Tax=Macrophomina phaseolina (strain MS6) TaxID=1126212 RepID=K2SLM1_MACPH|nr:hypothetical protein MPH_05094 [Macrophomina phaseolina MS6]